MIKSGRLRYDSIEKLIRKYYKRTESVLCLYDITANPELQLKTDYLLVNQQRDVVLQLGIIKAVKSKEQICHCNSFMVDYKKDADYDLHYRNLTHCYEISKIVREEKDTKRAEVIYQSMDAFGVYHTLDILNDRKELFEKCMDKRAESLVTDFLVLWEGKRDGI